MQDSPGPLERPQAEADRDLPWQGKREYAGGPRAHRAALWFVGQRGFGRIFRIVQIMVLGRLFVHNRGELGQFSTIMAVIIIVDKFSQTGMSSAVIARAQADARVLNVSWTINLLRSVLLYLAVFYVAGLLAISWEDPRLALLLRLVGCTLIIKALANPGVLLLERRMNVRPIVLAIIAGEFVGVVVTILFAIVLRNAMALVLGALAGASVAPVFSYFIHPYRPRFQIERGMAKELLSFGWKVGVTTTIIALVERGGLFFLRTVAGEEGKEVAARYHYGYQFADLAVMSLVVPAMRVFFPVFSSVQQDQRSVYAVYARNFSMLLAVVAPVAAALLVLAPQVVRIFLGMGWVDIIVMVRVFSVLIIINSFRHVYRRMFVAMRRPGWVTITRGVDLVLFAVLIYPLWQSHGVLGVCLARVLCMPLGLVVEIWLAAQLLERSMFSMVRPMLGILAAAGLSAGAACLLAHSLPALHLCAQVGLVGVGGAICYIVLMILLSPDSLRHGVRLFRSILRTQ